MERFYGGAHARPHTSRSNGSGSKIDDINGDVGFEKTVDAAPEDYDGVYGEQVGDQFVAASNTGDYQLMHARLLRLGSRAYHMKRAQEQGPR